MPTLLRIDCSPRTEQSHSRRLANFIESKWLQLYPKSTVVYRDLLNTNVPHISNDTIAGFHTPSSEMTLALKEATALSDELISELKQADEIIISSPLYNLSTPSVLKAYIDQVVRSGHTFAVKTDGTYEGLLKGRKVHLALVMGANYTDGSHRLPDFQHSHLKAILSLIGLEVVNVFSLEGTADYKALGRNLPLIHNQIVKELSTS